MIVAVSFSTNPLSSSLSSPEIRATHIRGDLFLFEREFYAQSASKNKAIFRARTYDCIT